MDTTDYEDQTPTAEIQGAPGGEWFDNALLKLSQVSGAIARRERRRDALLARTATEINEWFDTETAQMRTVATQIKAAIEEAMAGYVAATDKKLFKSPYGRIAQTNTDKWVWPDDAGNKTGNEELIEFLAGVDKELFVRETVTTAVDKVTTKNAIVVKEDTDEEGNLRRLLLIDGEPVPHVQLVPVTSYKVTPAVEIEGAF